MKNKRTLLIATALILISVMVITTVIAFGQKDTEKSLESDKAEGKTVYYDEKPYTDPSLYVESYGRNNDDVMKAVAYEVCKKYNLDPKTVKISDMTKEMLNYDFALYLQKANGNNDLLLKEKKAKEPYPLETLINDVHCFNGAKQIIIDVCEKYDIDYQNAKIKDLSGDMIMEIDDLAYEKSNHKDL